MNVTLEDLQEDIKENGAVFETINGNGFKVLTENPCQKTYNTTIKNYTAVMKTLCEMVPENKDKDALMKFLGRGAK